MTYNRGNFDNNGLEKLMKISQNFKSWWQQYRESIECSRLREELRLLLYGEAGNEEDIAKKLINFERYTHPGELESWYLKKVIYDLRKRFLVNQ